MRTALDQPGIALDAGYLIGLRTLAVCRDDAAYLSALPGTMVAKKRGQGQDFADVREYVDGDDIRHLDRGSTARTGMMHVRSFQEDRDRVTLLVADFRPSMLWGSRRAFRSVAAAEALTLIGWRAIEEGGRVGLITLGVRGQVAITARGRVRGMLAVIGGLVAAHMSALQTVHIGLDQESSLASALTRVGRVAPKGAEVVIASGFDTPGTELAEHLGRLARRGAPRLIWIEDAATDLAPGLYPVRLPDGSKQRIRVADQGGAMPIPDDLSAMPVLRLNAGAPVREMVRRIDQGFAIGQGG